MTLTLESYFRKTSETPTYRSFGDTASHKIIAIFDKTPPSIVCPHFWELRWAYGCPYDCAYCYLKGTFYGKKDPRFPYTINQIEKTINTTFQKLADPQIFNSGELSDSLMNPDLMTKIADIFENQSKHKLLILTKSNNVDFLVKKPRKQTIVSFSLNASTPAKLWENRAPDPLRRIEAAKSVSDVGYETRIRIDPIFPTDNWRDEYNDIIYAIISAFTPDRITLGTPRGLLKTIRFSADTSWTKYFGENSGWGKKIPENLRKEIYEFHINKLNDLSFDKSRIALCKETKEMWHVLGLDCTNIRCNCVW